MPASVFTISSCAFEPGVGGQAEAVADLHALDRLDAHQRAGQPRVEAAVPVHVRAEARRQAVDDDLDHAAEGVAVLVGLVDRRHHLLRGVGVQAAHRVLVEAGDVVRAGHRAVRRGHAAELDDVGDDAGADGLLEEVGGDPAERHPGGGLAGGGALEDRAGLVEVVLLHADEVGVARAGAGERGVAGQAVELGLVDRVGRHDLLPLGPLGVADLDGHRSAEGLAVADAADDGDLVLLELHPGAAAVAEATAGEGVGDVVGGDRDVGGQALQDRDEGRSVGLARSEPAQHGQSLSRRPAGTAPAVSRRDTRGRPRPRRRRPRRRAA